jgi:alpha-1,6-mannosyltransferase
MGRVPSLSVIRYTGLAAACLLALAGILGGALPDGDVASTPVSIAQGPYGAVILLGWLAGTVGQAYAWWAARDRVPSARWAVVTIAMWVLPFLVVPPMGSRDVYSYACQGYLFANGMNPYEVGVASLPCPWLDAVSPIWRDTAAPYGPLFVLVTAAVVQLGGSLTAVVVLFRLVALAGVVAVVVCLPVLARRCGVPAGRALWVALAGPLVGAHLIAGPHNDALMIGLVVAGLALVVVRSRHPAAQLGAGALLGLAIAVKATAVVVVPFVVLIAVSRPYRLGPAVRAGGAVLGGALAAMAALTAASGLGVGWISGVLHVKDLIQFTSPPTAVGMTLTFLGRLAVPGFDAVPAVRLLALGLLAAILIWLWLRAARADEPVPAALHGAGLALAAIIALAPSFHPWYALWPLVLLAATTVRTDLVMAASIAAALVVLPDGGGLARFVKFLGAPLMTLLIIVLVVRHLRRAKAADREPVGPSSEDPRQPLPSIPTHRET